MTSPTRPLVGAGLALGTGLGALFDGIVFHQLLQFHNMLSVKYPPTTLVNLEINMFWDGVFHAFAWAMTVLGVGLLWNAARRADAILATQILVGAVLIGAALFNVIEGVIDHHLLTLHHVRDGAQSFYWDIGFLAISAAMGTVGIVLVLRARRPGAAEL
jgi:uncharacterized membrane protein